MKKHAKLAMDMGMKESCIQIAEIGDTIELTSRTIKRGEQIPAGSRFVDGIGIDDTDSFVLRDRIHLSEDGLVVVVTCIDELSAELNSLEIISKGLVFDADMISEAKMSLAKLLEKIDLKAVRDENELSSIIRRGLKNIILKKTKKNPMILPIIMVV